MGGLFQPSSFLRRMPLALGGGRLWSADQSSGPFREPVLPREPGRGTLARIGSLEARITGSRADIRAAQELRYQVFYEEMCAVPDRRSARRRRDADAFDRVCDHLIVEDHSCRTGPRLRPRIVGTYRLLRQEVAVRHGGFYTLGEFDIGPLLAHKPSSRFLELGRSCVAEDYRNKRTLELLWRGIWAYACRHSIDVMIGCASLQGTDPERLALPLSFLHHWALASPEWRVRAYSSRRVEMNRLTAAAIDPKAAMRALPPLLKGYLRLGAYVGDGAVVDQQFGTTDVCIVLPTAAIGQRYVSHFSAEPETVR